MKILELQNVEKIYGEKENQVKALRDINLEIEEGEFVAIVGTSGSGKSTLLNLIGGLDNPTRGKVFIKDKEIGSLSRKELTIFRRRNIGFVFQNYSLMPVLNVYDNVAFGRNEKNIQASCPADSSSEWPLRGPLWVSRRCFSVMSPREIWIPPQRSRSWAC